MNTILRLKGAASFATSLLAVALAQPAGAQITPFSEPEVIFYGKVCDSGDPANCTLLTSGTLVWTLTPPTGNPIVVTTELEAYPNGMSYMLKIPAEVLLAGTTVSPNTLPTGPTNVTYNRSSVTVGGVPYLIASAGGGGGLNTFAYSSAQRGRIERIDLALTLAPDADNDGMSDAFETLYAADGLNPNNPGDANGDIDGDGRTNLQEAQAGTDPNGFDYATWAALPGNGLSPAERDKNFDKDSDEMSNWFEFAIGAHPGTPDASFASSVVQASFVTVGAGRHFALSFTKPSARRLGVGYAIEGSSLLTGPWKRVADGSLLLIEDSRSTLKARETQPANSKGFLRLAADEL
jgi:hypothetical protein